MEKRTRILLIILGALAAAAAGFYAYGMFFGGKEEQPSQPVITAQKPPAAKPAGPQAGQPVAPPAPASGQKPADAGKAAQPVKPEPPVIKAVEKGKEARYASAEDFMKKTSMKPEEIRAFSQKYLDDSKKARDAAKAKKDKTAEEAAGAQVRLAEKLAGLVAANLKEEKPQEPVRKDYNYISLNKRDPFMNPMQVPKVYPPVPPNAKPFERVPVEHLAVKAILWNEKGYRAMVVTPDGRGYTVKVGDPLGDKRGRITRITEKRVYVTEKIPDVLGEIETKNTILQLHKEAE